MLMIADKMDILYRKCEIRNLKFDVLIPELVGLLIFGTTTGYVMYLCWLAFNSKSWPFATGHVTRSRILPGRRNEATYNIYYEYEVDGHKYKGNRIRFGGALNWNSTDAQKTIQTYPADSSVTVYYHSRRPSIATLERRISGFIVLWLVIGLLVTIGIGGGGRFSAGGIKKRCDKVLRG